MKRLKHLLKQLLISLLVAELCFPVLPLYSADITVDTSVPVNQRPTLDTAQNGVVIINLATTTAGGVSVNRFTEYNVGSNGIILNNSTEMGISVLGGAVYGNPNYQLNGREALIVVNEVTGTKRSDILGYIEMFGGSAEFILVNPNGIMLNGAGFINMPRVTLGTGRAVYDANGFSGIDVDGGMVSIEGNGVNAGTVDYFTVITRMASLNGAIWGNDVSIITGTGTYNYNDRIFTRNETGTPFPELGIDASVFGSIYAGRIILICNEKGVGVRSSANMLADVSDISISADGSIELNNTQAAGNIQVASGSDRIVQRGDAFAMGDITYSGTGFTNRGNVNALGNITIEGYIDNQSGKITANENITLHTGGIISNSGGSIILSGDTGRIWVYGNDSLELHGGEIKSAGGIDIEMTGNVVFSSDISSVYADRYLNIEGLNFINGTGLLLNGSVNVYVSGDIINESGSRIVSNSEITFVSGEKITNSGEVSGLYINITGSYLDNNTGAVLTGGNGVSSLNITGTINNSGRISGASDLTVRASEIINTDDMSETQISSGGNLTVDTGTLQNNGSVLFSAGDMNITTKTLNNIRGYIYSMGNMVLKGKENSGNSIYNYSGNIEADGTAAGMQMGNTTVHGILIDIGDDGSLINTGEDTGNYTMDLVTVGDIGDDEWAVMQRYEFTSTMYTDYSCLVSGGDMNITAGNVVNHGSVIAAGNDLTIDADTLSNETVSMVEYLPQYEYEGNNKRVKKKHKLGPFKWKWGWTHKKYYRSQSGYVTVPSNSKAIISAGGDVTVNATEIGNEEIIKESVGVNIEGRTGILANTTSVIEDVMTTGFIDVGQYIRTDGLFRIDTNPASQYLIETRLDYIDVSKLKGSEYLLERINFNPEADLRFVGDAYYEQELVSEAILVATSRKFLDDSLMSEQEQMAWLLDNAATAYEDLELAVGVELTKEQINQLQQPIIWYVEDVVMGVKVLVPRVYIPEHILDGFTTDSSSVIAGNTVKINASGDVNNSGVITGTSSVDIKAHDNITNSSGVIASGGNVSLVTETGDIINETKVYSSDGSGYTNSELGRTATIESGGDLTVSSGGDFVNRGADVSSGGDASITAGGNIDFETVRTEEEGYSEQHGTYGVSDVTTVTGSTLTTGGDLEMTSGHDINFIGSSADVAGDADVKAEGNFNLINDYDTSHYQGDKTNDKTFSSSTVKVTEDTKTVVSSTFNTGGDLNVESGNDINIVGSEINAGGNADLDAEGDQNIIAAHDEHYYSKTKETSGIGVGGSIYG
ncbi:MAG TPA: filamentous hemagglutinin N-terminal domain-containing protein, partial [Spirochaetota bacterium]|nr:filamentous hemagglutinin N-terminal domain-containing protein [Spirochaetota bacterium]